MTRTTERAVPAGALCLALALALGAFATFSAHGAAAQETESPVADVSTDLPTDLGADEQANTPGQDVITKVLGKLQAGELLEEKGNWAGAASFAEEALALARTSGDPTLIAAARGAFGFDLLQLGEAERAVEQFSKAAVLWQAIEGPDGDYTIWTYGALGAAYEETGELGQALTTTNTLRATVARRFGDEHPYLQELDAKIAALEEQASGRAEEP